MRFLVARTVTFRDREPWGENVDMSDEIRLVDARGNRLPKSLRAVATRWFQLQHGLQLLWKSRCYDAVAVGRHGVFLPILQRLFGIKRRVVMTDTEWPGIGTGLVNHAAGMSSAAICCNTRWELENLSRRFEIPKEKFRLVLMAFQRPDMREPRDEGYIFAGGDCGRDWNTFVEAVDGLPYEVRVFVTRTKLPRVPPNVTVAAVPRAEYYNQMAAASCVVVPTVHEQLRVTGTTTWINALGMGKVVIATDPCGAPDYMEQGVSGFYVGHGDMEALRRCIAKVMEDAELRKRVGQAARDRAWREFSPEAFRRQVLSLLDSVAFRGGSFGAA
jgi:hypothetical protein